MPIIEPLVVEITDIFDKWLTKLNDIIAATEIRKRIKRLEQGNFGDHKSIKGVKAISELRIHINKGYRIYYTMTGKTVVLLLCAGIKDDQSRDIVRADEIRSTLKQRGQI
jgi:putative addiction module killer protein